MSAEATQRILILGGVRSGKSAQAEQWAKLSARPVTYLATARIGDEEMRARIAQHRSTRPAHWQVVEEPVALASTLLAHAQPEGLILVDCLTLWLTNLLLDSDPQCAEREQEALLALLPTLPGTLILVSNETGLGVVPTGELTRRFCDQAGRLHQALATLCDPVLLMVAGLPLFLKGYP
jgi:adenosylcobinamide kinase/adenosylcobinamide-phosphate guanylyltransferase